MSHRRFLYGREVASTKKLTATSLLVIFVPPTPGRRRPAERWDLKKFLATVQRVQSPRTRTA